MNGLIKKIGRIFIAVSILAGCGNSYNLQKGDIVQTASSNDDSNRLDKFIADAEKGIEGKVRVVRIVEPNYTPVDEEIEEEKPKGTILYDIKSGYDEQAKEGWLEVRPDYSYYTASENEQEMQPQQCGSIVKDEERGYYMLTECFHAWEYELIPL
ncbi:hypothetical protein ACXM0N_09805 [Peribacillus simplex]